MLAFVCSMSTDYPFTDSTCQDIKPTNHIVVFSVSSVTTQKPLPIGRFGGFLEDLAEHIGAYGIGGFGVPVGFRKSYQILPVAKRVKAPTGVRREQASTGRG